MRARRHRPASSSAGTNLTRAASETGPRALGVLSLGFLRQPRLRALCAAAGFPVRAGFGGCDTIGVWGRRPVSWRGAAVARLRNKPLITLEDGFLRSVHPGASHPTVSLIFDDLGVYYDASGPSRLETFLQEGVFDLPRADAAIAKLRRLRLSKYNSGADIADPPQGHILLIDQKPGDASIRYGGASADSFTRMLMAAKADHPDAEIIIKSHPDAGRHGHFAGDLPKNCRIVTDPVTPWDLIDGAAAVYTVTSQMGFEALIAGKTVRCFGAPFYAGWGATEDEIAVPRRTARRSVREIFAAAYLDYPTYFDPWRNQVTTCEAAMDALAFLRELARAEPAASIATGIRLWKRKYIAGFLDRRNMATRFEDKPDKAVKMAKAKDRRVVVWAGKETPELTKVAAANGVAVSRMEDGFLRSIGLGAALTPPLSLCLDDQGIYYDATRPSRLETLIASAPDDEEARARARALIDAITALNLTKYNLSDEARPAPPPAGRRVILAPGQVEDDASIRFGAGEIRTNAALLNAVRAAAPDAWIIYKPHPDVEAGLRPGALSPDATAAADQIFERTSAATALSLADEVWTMTSLTGFEALLRGKSVTTFGAPFYAGWGLTTDLGAPPDRRRARPTLEQLVHAALIDYPIYRDPISGVPCTPELILERLTDPETVRNAGGGAATRWLAKAQGALASYAHLWR